MRVRKKKYFISEITVAELKFGVANMSDDKRKEENRLSTDFFLSAFSHIPIIDTLDFYANEKSRLRKLGTPIQEVDLLIGCAAVVNDFIMVTNNEKHFSRIEGIKIENWTK